MISCLVLGSGGAVPTRDRAPAGYWVVVDGLSILLDPGPGSLARAIHDEQGPAGVDDIRTVLLSHLHIDHAADAVPLLFALHSSLPAGTDPIQLIGPPGLARYLGLMREVYGEWISPARRELIVTELEPGSALGLDPDCRGVWRAEPAGSFLRDDGAQGLAAGGRGRTGGGPTVAAWRANHTETRLSDSNLCFRFRDGGGGVLAYSGDGERGQGLTEAAREADLLIVECSTPDELYTPGHMTPSAVAALCAEARPRRVVLTHLYPPAAALDLPALVRERYDGRVEKARDGAVYTVP